MIIKSISLTNFRNHTTYHLECNPDTTLILGENGCGKTSVLEAIYILTRGKSFRATDPDIIKRDTDFYRIELEYNNGENIIALYDGKIKIFLCWIKNLAAFLKNTNTPSFYFYHPILILLVVPRRATVNILTVLLASLVKNIVIIFQNTKNLFVSAMNY